MCLAASYVSHSFLRYTYCEAFLSLSLLRVLSLRVFTSGSQKTTAQFERDNEENKRRTIIRERALFSARASSLDMSAFRGSLCVHFYMRIY